MDFVMSNKLGYKKDFVACLERTDLLGDKAEAFRNELLKIPGVEKVSGTTAAPGVENYFGQSFQLKGTTEAEPAGEFLQMNLPGCIITSLIRDAIQ
jgi:hypothetical protein